MHKQQAQAAHGRLSTRTASIYQKNISDFILDDQWSTYIKTVVQVQRHTNVFDTKTKQYITRSETAFYISNSSLISAQTSNQCIIQHWGIENRNHYVRDVALQEDACRVRKNPYNLSVLRSIALNILRANKVNNIKGQIFQNSIKWTQVFNYPQIA